MSSTSPATIVGSANGRSITALTNPLPGNSSRTSTHAIAVPVTAWIAATIADAASVSFSAASASGEVTTCQKTCRPSACEAPDDGRERDQDDEAEVDRQDAAGEGRAERPDPLPGGTVRLLRERR